MANLNTMKNPQLGLLAMEILDKFDGDTPPDLSPEQCRVIATAFALLQSRMDLRAMLDNLIMLMSSADPELDYARHTLKNLARFLNDLNHPAIRTH